jgi:hypothetical protein
LYGTGGECEHELAKTDEIAATCTTEGNPDYWYCSVCEKYFADEGGTTELQEEQIVTAIDPANHAVGCDPEIYVILNTEVATEFTATKGLCVPVSAGSNMPATLTAIRTSVGDNNPVTIQFGDNEEALVMGTQNVSLTTVTNAWGHITLKGKITGNNSSDMGTSGQVVIGGNVSVTSTADITNESPTAGTTALNHNSTGILTIQGGTVSAAAGIAIRNNSTGEVIISQTANMLTLITSASTNNQTGTIHNFTDDGSIRITGGTVSATSSGTSGRAIYNVRGGSINITGGIISVTGSGRAIQNNGAGSINISGGTVQAIETNGYGIWNQAAGTVTIQDGTISAVTTGRAINNNGAGTVTIHQPPAKLYTGAAETTYETAAGTNKDRTGTTMGTIVWIPEE